MQHDEVMNLTVSTKSFEMLGQLSLPVLKRLKVVLSKAMITQILREEIIFRSGGSVLPFAKPVFLVPKRVSLARF
jgi:hypothetical protein